MFKIEYHEDSQIVSLMGNLDTSKTSEANELLDKIENSITIDMSKLDFICSGGIGTLIKTYRRLKANGKNIYLTNLNSNMKKIFELALLDTVFDIK
ncbi:MAG: STAS domain-containing protein [Ignavibacteria bacterium]|nr:STAS domain-containing protein [Ignavibacteria bacterium]NNG26907.1 STAS domain-containing protein [Ignavibacteriaceae bacterium]